MVAGRRDAARRRRGYAALFGTLLASLVALATDIDVGGNVPGPVPPPLPNPEWVRWEDDGPGPCPAIPYFDDRPAIRSLPGGVEDAAHRIRERMALSRLPHVLGHADGETQDLCWHGTTPLGRARWGQPRVVAGGRHRRFRMWRVRQRRATDAGTDGEFGGVPRRLPGDPSAVHQRGTRGGVGREPLAPCTTRGEAIRDLPPVAITAVREQAAERLRLADA
jgi:hypothetical protein